MKAKWIIFCLLVGLFALKALGGDGLYWTKTYPNVVKDVSDSTSKAELSLFYTTPDTNTGSSDLYSNFFKARTIIGNRGYTQDLPSEMIMAYPSQLIFRAAVYSSAAATDSVMMILKGRYGGADVNLDTCLLLRTGAVGSYMLPTAKTPIVLKFDSPLGQMGAFVDSLRFVWDHRGSFTSILYNSSVELIYDP